jgi:hypothetical protein
MSVHIRDSSRDALGLKRQLVVGVRTRHDENRSDVSELR